MKPENEFNTWLQPEQSLAEISRAFPEEWEAVKQALIAQNRPNRWDRYLMKRLFFSKTGEPKPVYLLWFRVLWPLVCQKAKVMKTMELQGAYCFYSEHFIKRLAQIIGSRHCLEVAAGDGSLSHFLTQRNVLITATDNQEWDFAIRYPENVHHCTAEEALQKYRPEVVLCAWPPKNNDFERRIFETPSVQTYILIASHRESASGNWAAYRQQQTFSFEEDDTLSAFVLQPLLDPAVYLFHRKR